MLLFLSSLSYVQIDQPEFDILLQKEQEQKIYAQVKESTQHARPASAPRRKASSFGAWRSPL